MLDDDRLRRFAAELCEARGVRAVALGGSRARGTPRPDSDFDLGVYVDPDVDLSALGVVACRWADADVVISPRGGWGPWVDSGAWLRVDGVAVDLILRDVSRVAEQCSRARRGEFAFHVQPGHPLGFLDVAYAGEVATCVPLSDPDQTLEDLAQSVTPYPEPLRAALLENLWQVGFLLDAAVKGARSTDVGYVALCAATATMIAAHGWHAAAGEWVMNEKGLIPNVARLPIDTRGFSTHADETLASLGSTPDSLQKAIDTLRGMPLPT